MQFEYLAKVQSLQSQLNTFMAEHIYPNEAVRAQQLAANLERGSPYAPWPLLEELKTKARAAGLWNLFLPKSASGAGLSNLEYAPLAEIMGQVLWSPEVFNCNAPDTGNMETLERYGSAEQKAQWLAPLLKGDIRSAFAMTEPNVASSDATNIEARIERDGDEYIINGRKWFSSGAANERTTLFILMGKTDPKNTNRHLQQSMILVPKNAPGVSIVRDLHILGAKEYPEGHPEVLFENVRVPVSNILLGEGRGFEIAQGRLGPGRIHHCMRVIGAAERALQMMCARLSTRIAFQKSLADQGVWRERIAESRIAIDQTRFLVLNAADCMDRLGNKVAAQQIAMIKVAAPNMACKVIDWAIQAHGGGGFTQDFPLAHMYTYARTLRMADGPDEVHRNAIAKRELARAAARLTAGSPL